MVGARRGVEPTGAVRAGGQVSVDGALLSCEVQSFRGGHAGEDREWAQPEGTGLQGRYVGAMYRGDLARRETAGNSGQGGREG